MAAFRLKTPEHRELTGGDLLAQSLKHVGVTVAFGIHGGHLDAFLVGCEFIGIKLIDTRHETVAVQAAEGYSKITGKVGTCFVTANSGYSNGLPGLATAFADRSSIFCITSSVPLRDQENNSLQGQVDQVVVAKPITKFAHRVTHAEDIPRLVSHAIRISTSGPPGPILIDFPIDVLFSPLSQARISWGSISAPLPYPPGPHSDAITEALSVLKEAQRPVVIIGTGARSQKAVESLTAFIEATQTPLFYNKKYCYMAPLNSNPLFVGPADCLALLPSTGAPSPDCILLLGARTGMYLGGQSGAIIPKQGCKIIQVDADGGELGRTYAVQVGITSDVEQAVQALNSRLSGIPVRASAEWVKTATGLRDIPSPHEKESVEMSPGRPHPYHALSSLFSSLPEGPVVVLDGGECALWASEIAHRARPHTIMSATGYLGFLGNGFGYALGCAVGAPDRLVVNLQGDGSAGFHFMDLDTYARFKLNILTVVVNNYCWGMSCHGQELLYGSKTPARPVSSLSSATAYDIVAQGLGNHSAKVSKVEDVAPAVRRLVEAEGPACMELLVSDKPIHPGTAALVNPTEDPNMIVVPYYDNIPRPHYKS